MRFHENILGLSCPEENRLSPVDGKPMEIEFTGEPPPIPSTERRVLQKQIKFVRPYVEESKEHDR